LGRRCIVVSGVGRVQRWNGPVEEIRPGDTVWIPPDEKHWHGASPTSGLVHLALHEHQNGVHVTWLEHVTDEQYAVAPTG
jgi:quercetin dioxygenase-like cupin family protein